MCCRSTPIRVAMLSVWRDEPDAPLALGSSLARRTKLMRSMACCTVDPEFCNSHEGTQTQQVAVKRVKATRDPKTLAVCCVLEPKWLRSGCVVCVCCVLCAVCCVQRGSFSGQRRSVLSHERKGKGSRQNRSDKNSPSLGVAVHGSQYLGCFEGRDELKLSTPLSHQPCG